MLNYSLILMVVIKSYAYKYPILSNSYQNNNSLQKELMSMLSG